MPKRKGLRYRTRKVKGGKYQKLAFKGRKLKAVSTYKSKKGRDKKLSEHKFK